MNDLSIAAARFENWCRNDALPLWARAAKDVHGGYYEQLKLDGKPDIGVTRRVRVQARLIYVYALAAELGWYKDGKNIADHGTKFLMGPGLAGGDDIDGTGFKGCAHLVSDQGELVDGMRDTYAQAFLILAMAWRHRAFGDRQAAQIMRQTVEFLDTHLKADNGGWYEGLPASLPRRQNPHMHLFEAFLACYESTNDDYYLNLADEMFHLFETVFFDEASGCLIEFFNQDWTPADGIGDLTEPGHMLEWSWILRWYQSIGGRNVEDYARTLYDVALEKGRDPNSGFIIDEMRLDGTPTKTTRRSWPQTELIKAGCAGLRDGISKCGDDAAWAINELFNSYLDVPICGGWNDQYDENGQVLTNIMPTSTFYHLICAAAEARAVASSAPAKEQILANA
ncbi:MAG: AGE family epimerase/isomerase [bacterium]